MEIKIYVDIEGTNLCSNSANPFYLRGAGKMEYSSAFSRSAINPLEPICPNKFNNIKSILVFTMPSFPRIFYDLCHGNNAMLKLIESQSAATVLREFDPDIIVTTCDKCDTRTRDDQVVISIKEIPNGRYYSIWVNDTENCESYYDDQDIKDYINDKVIKYLERTLKKLDEELAANIESCTRIKAAR